MIHAVPKKRSKTAPQQREMGAHVFAGMRSSAKHGSADGAGMADWAKKSGKGNVIMQMMQVRFVIGWDNATDTCRTWDTFLAKVSVRISRALSSLFKRRCDQGGRRSEHTERRLKARNLEVRR